MLAIEAVSRQVDAATVPSPRLIAAAHEFEAQLMKELLRPMAGGDEENDSGSCGALADFAGEALGQALSKHGGFGIATSILQSLSRNGRESQSDPSPGKDISGGLK